MMQRDFFQRRGVREHQKRAPERSTHIALADRLRINTPRTGWWFSHIPSGELRTERTGALLKRMGARAGMLDFLLIAPSGGHHWLELKRGLEPLNDDQDLFVTMLRERGVPYFVARSYDAAVKQLTAWGTI